MALWQRLDHNRSSFRCSDKFAESWNVQQGASMAGSDYNREFSDSDFVADALATLSNGARNYFLWVSCICVE